MRYVVIIGATILVMAGIVLLAVILALAFNELITGEVSYNIELNRRAKRLHDMRRKNNEKESL